MPILSEHDIFIIVAELGVIIFMARFFGELAKRLGQPIIAGEVAAGVILGPAVIGRFFPAFHAKLFPVSGPDIYILQGISWLCVIFLLLITGLEIDSQASLRHGKRNVLTSILGISLPFLAVFVLTYYLPSHFYPDNISRTHVNLLIAIALSVFAIPDISKILFDLKILRSFVGLNIMVAGVLGDIWGWTALAFVISMTHHTGIAVFEFIRPLATMVLYLIFAFTAGRSMIDKLFSWIGLQTKEDDAAPVIAILFALALINCAVAYLIGIHVIFGAFVAGIMAGESKRITPYLRQSIQDFIFGIFAPVFFVLVGMYLKFDNAMNWKYIVMLFFVASIFKIAGGYWGALIGGIGRKNALAVGLGLNTQGTMGVIIALIGRDMGLFNEDLFSVIVIVCVSSSVLLGPSLRWAMKRVKRPIAKYFDENHIFLNIHGRNKGSVISHMAQEMSRRGLIQHWRPIKDAIWQREESMSTAIGSGVAVPHARIAGLKDPILCFFRLETPVDFQSPDNEPVRLLFLELTDSNDDGMQLTLVSQVARFVSHKKNIQKLLNAKDKEAVHHILSFDEGV